MRQDPRFPDEGSYLGRRATRMAQAAMFVAAAACAITAVIIWFFTGDDDDLKDLPRWKLVLGWAIFGLLVSVVLVGMVFGVRYAYS